MHSYHKDIAKIGSAANTNNRCKKCECSFHDHLMVKVSFGNEEWIRSNNISYNRLATNVTLHCVPWLVQVIALCFINLLHLKKFDFFCTKSINRYKCSTYFQIPT